MTNNNSRFVENFEAIVDNASSVIELRDDIIPNIMQILWKTSSDMKEAVDSNIYRSLVEFHYDMVQIRKKAQSKMMSIATAQVKNKR